MFTEKIYYMEVHYINELISTNFIDSSSYVLDSREVAEMVGKTHAHLCRDIDNYVKVISENPKLDSQNFFIERTESKKYFLHR